MNFVVGASGLMENNLLEYVDNCLEQCGLLEYGNIYTPSNSPPPPEWTNVGRDYWSVIGSSRVLEGLGGSRRFLEGLEGLGGSSRVLEGPEVLGGSWRVRRV